MRTYVSANCVDRDFRTSDLRRSLEGNLHDIDGSHAGPEVGSPLRERDVSSCASAH